jgi:hypothetical protein
MLKDTAKSKNFFHGGRYGLTILIVTMIFMAVFNLIASAGDTKQKKFKSPEDAFRAVVEATKNNDTSELLAIFGPEGRDIISSGDAVADRAGRVRFVKSAEEGIKFSKLGDDKVLTAVGKNEWCFPIPLVKSGQEWVFLTEDGREEIVNRRIGRNELNTIRVSLAYVDAQREYFSKEREKGRGVQYAQKFMSRKGMKDGLYWESAEGEEMSPLGPLFARATEEGYTVRKPGEKHKPYYGYLFRILKSQGSSAPGGELDYVIKDRMTAGFGLVAYPAAYGVSGIMTFIVNQQGTVYEKDLGPKTEEIAKAMTKYNPDNTWKKIEKTAAASD